MLHLFYAPSALSPYRPITVKLQLSSTGADRGQKGRSPAVLRAGKYCYYILELANQ